MATYRNGQESSQLAKITNFERTGKDTKLDKITISYQRSDDSSGTTLTGSKFTSNFTDEEKNLIKESKANNSEVNIVKVFQQKEGADKGYWNLKSIRPKSAYQEKPKQSNNSNFTKTSNTSGTKYNDAGVKAGAVLHDAVAVAIAQAGKNVTVSTVAQVARELLKLSTDLENEVRSGTYNTSTPFTTSTPSPSSDIKEETDTLDLDALLDEFNSSEGVEL